MLQGLFYGADLQAVGAALNLLQSKAALQTGLAIPEMGSDSE